MDARYEGKAATILARVNNFFLRLRFGDGSTRVVAARQVAVLDRGKAALTVVKNEPFNVHRSQITQPEAAE